MYPIPIPTFHLLSLDTTISTVATFDYAGTFVKVPDVCDDAQIGEPLQAPDSRLRNDLQPDFLRNVLRAQPLTLPNSTSLMVFLQT